LQFLPSMEKKTSPSHVLRKFLVHLGASFAVLGIVACANENFTSSAKSCQGSGASCVAVNGVDSFSYTVSASTQPIDVLFVVDNSASMYSIQQQISSRFPSLFSTLNQYDYHLAITTTDVVDSDNAARSTITLYGQNTSIAYGQSGALVTFSNGRNYVQKSDADAENEFRAAIARPETLSCEQYIASQCSSSGCTDANTYHLYCPSEDTRAIAASVLTLQNDGSGFIRKNAPLAVVIVSNADERAAGNQPGAVYALAANDQPATLVSLAQSLNKPLSAYSIVIQNGDQACYNSQHFSTTLFGWYGLEYASLSSQAPGGTSSICSSDFSQNLATIGSGISNQMTSLTLYCAPLGGSVTVTYPGGKPQTLLTTSSNSTTLQLPTPLTPGQTLQVSYSCRSL